MAKASSIENAIITLAALSGHHGDTGHLALWPVVGMEFKRVRVNALMKPLLVRLIFWRLICRLKIIWSKIKIALVLENKRKNVETGHAQWCHQADRDWIQWIVKQIKVPRNLLIGLVHYCLWKKLQKILVIRSLWNQLRCFLISSGIIISG